MTDLLLHLAGAIALQLAFFDAAEPETRESLTRLVESCRQAQPQPYLASSHAFAPLVKRAIEGGRDGGIREILLRLLPVQASLPWVYHYVPRSAAEDLGDRIAFAELIGPDGPLWAPKCRVGFTVLAEEILYPLHSHPAVELYFVLSGRAHWSTPTSGRDVLPGGLVLHRTGEAHAMRTYNEPLLALWAWRGDLDSPALYV